MRDGIEVSESAPPESTRWCDCSEGTGRPGGASGLLPLKPNRLRKERLLDELLEAVDEAVKELDVGGGGDDVVGTGGTTSSLKSTTSK